VEDTNGDLVPEGEPAPGADDGVLDNVDDPVEGPAEVEYDVLAPASFDGLCDPAAGLVEVEVGQCAVLVTPDPAWVEVGTFGGVLALAALGALVVGQLRRG
jgi:hypothetical protein